MKTLPAPGMTDVKAEPAKVVTDAAAPVTAAAAGEATPAALPTTDVAAAAAAAGSVVTKRLTNVETAALVAEKHTPSWKTPRQRDADKSMPGRAIGPAAVAWGVAAGLEV